jgi:hypothetical protein
MITAGALFALTAPAAQASLDRILPAKAPLANHHKISPTRGTTTHLPKVHKKTTGPLYIYFPGTPNQASSAPSQDDCVLGDNCTVEQICAIWGMNCDTAAGTPTTDATPVEPVQAASTQSAAPAAEALSVSSSATDVSMNASDEDC